MIKMDLDQELKKQAVIVDLIRALKVDEQRKLHISGVLYNRDIDELVNQKDIEAIKAKLSGRRVVLNPRQKELLAWPSIEEKRSGLPR